MQHFAETLDIQQVYGPGEQYLNICCGKLFLVVDSLSVSSCNYLGR